MPGVGSLPSKWTMRAEISACLSPSIGPSSSIRHVSRSFPRGCGPAKMPTGRRAHARQPQGRWAPLPRHAQYDRQLNHKAESVGRFYNADVKRKFGCRGDRIVHCARSGRLPLPAALPRDQIGQSPAPNSTDASAKFKWGRERAVAGATLNPHPAYAVTGHDFSGIDVFGRLDTHGHNLELRSDPSCHLSLKRRLAAHFPDVPMGMAREGAPRNVILHHLISGAGVLWMAILDHKIG